MIEGPLFEARQKLERARTITREAEVQCKIFWSKPPAHYEIYRRVTDQGLQEQLRVRIIRSPPAELSATIGDAVTNHRSSLDYLVCALARLNGQNDMRGVEWPFASTAEEFRSAGIQRKIKKVSKEAADLIGAQKPFRGGNDLLWSMNQLRRTTVHQHLIAAALTVNAVGGGLMLDAGIGYHTIEWHKWLTQDRDFAVLSFPSGSKLEHNLSVTMDVLLTGLEPLEGRAAIDVLEEFGNTVEDILDEFGQKFF